MPLDTYHVPPDLYDAERVRRHEAVLRQRWERFAFFGAMLLAIALALTALLLTFS